MSASHHRNLELVTPSYAPDFELCKELVKSVVRFAPEGTRHRVIVPRTDLAQFGALAGGNVVVETTDQVIPKGLFKVPKANIWLSPRSPWPPVRGWIAQQIVKLAAAAGSSADGVLLVDSDMVFVRPFSWTDYSEAESLTLYRLPDAVHAAMSQHLAWDTVARHLLGLPDAPDGERPDYIAWPCLWIPSAVRSLLRAVEEHENVPWQRAIGRRIQFSEMVLYGVYVDHVLAHEEPVSHRSSMKCAVHHEERALLPKELDHFFANMASTDVAIMVSAKSGTGLEDRRRALEQFFGETP